jgi:hypothetical protein
MIDPAGMTRDDLLQCVPRGKRASGDIELLQNGGQRINLRDLSESFAQMLVSLERNEPWHAQGHYWALAERGVCRRRAAGVPQA